jgi:hypothetical protein
MKDYVRILGAVKEMLNSRVEALNAYQNATKQLESKNEKFQKTKGNSKVEKELEEVNNQKKKKKRRVKV